MAIIIGNRTYLPPDITAPAAVLHTIQEKYKLAYLWSMRGWWWQAAHVVGLGLMLPLLLQETLFKAIKLKWHH